MSMISDLAISAVVIAIVATVQLWAIMTVSPGTEIYELAASAQRLNGDEHASFYYKILILWGPLIIHAVALLFPFVRAFRTDKTTGVY